MGTFEDNDLTGSGPLLGTRGGLEPLFPGKSLGVTAMKKDTCQACRRHLISPAQVQGGRHIVRWAGNTWRSRLVKTGRAGKLGPQRSKWLGGRWEKIFSYEHENHTTGQDSGVPTSLRRPGSISLLTCFFPSLSQIWNAKHFSRKLSDFSSLIHL